LIRGLFAPQGTEVDQVGKRVPLIKIGHLDRHPRVQAEALENTGKKRPRNVVAHWLALNAINQRIEERRRQQRRHNLDLADIQLDTAAYPAGVLDRRGHGNGAVHGGTGIRQLRLVGLKVAETREVTYVPCVR
jgi:hypothetical protein